MLYVIGRSVFYLAEMYRNATSTVHIMDTNKDPNRANFASMFKGPFENLGFQLY
jgi:hypothetical protein